MNVSDLLGKKGREIYSSSPDASLSDIVAELRRANVGALIIIENDAPVGIVSERDVIRYIADDDSRCLDKSVDTIMTKELVTCSPSTSINDVMSIMTESRIRHVPVLEDEKVVGVISIGDVVKNKIAEYQQEAELLKGYISGAEPA